jgi:hypothetical protein
MDTKADHPINWFFDISDNDSLNRDPMPGSSQRIKILFKKQNTWHLKGN